MISRRLGSSEWAVGYGRAVGWLGKLFGGASGDGARPAPPGGGDALDSRTPPAQLAERRPRMLMLHEGHLYPVVGEASYQRTLTRLAGRLGPDGPADDERWHVADLIPEPDNPHDPNAIGVVVGGEHVGYIARDRTELYHPFLRWARAAGWDGVSCRARIMGGFGFDDGGRAHLGIELHHTMPLLVQYDGPPPTIPDLDTGRVNLVGEQHHQEFLEACLHRRLLAQLVVEGEAVHAVVGGTRIGSLTAKMADRYRDLILREQQRCGRTPTCVCGVAPGTKKIEAHLKLPTGEALDVWTHELRAIQLQPAQAPADWYPDPHGQHRLRYFDGASWTDHVAG